MKNKLKYFSKSLYSDNLYDKGDIDSNILYDFL